MTATGLLDPTLETPAPEAPEEPLPDELDDFPGEEPIELPDQDGDGEEGGGDF